MTRSMLGRVSGSTAELVERRELRAHGGDVRGDSRSHRRSARARARHARPRRRLRDRRRGAARGAGRRGRRRHRHLRRPAREGARARREEEGLAIRFDEGDCQELPYGDAEFDAVASAFGAIFAPDHERAAGELARVCRPGGRLALTAWPKDEWSRRERARRADVPRRAPDARDWADEEHVRALLGDAFDLELQTGEWRVEADSGEELWELASTSMPPLRAWLEEQSDEARARAEQVYLDYLAPGVLARDYVLVLGTRR